MLKSQKRPLTQGKETYYNCHTLELGTNSPVDGIFPTKTSCAMLCSPQHACACEWTSTARNTTTRWATRHATRNETRSLLTPSTSLLTPNTQRNGARHARPTIYIILYIYTYIYMRQAARDDQKGRRREHHVQVQSTG